MSVNNTGKRIKMASIYNIPLWEAGQDYAINDIVYYELNSIQYYWYATTVITSASSPPTLFNKKWAGVKYDDKTTKFLPFFTWKPSYNFTVSQEPRVQSLRFGDGYEQRTVDGIESLLLTASINFDLRDSQETRAINHFFSARRGAEAFLFKLPAPHDLDKLYICRGWTSSMVFYNNNSISATFEEVTQ
jgi:phage-related protein